MSVFLVVVLMGFSCYVLHRWEQEEDRAPVPVPVPEDVDDEDPTDDDEELDDDPTLDEDDPVDDDSDDPFYGAGLADAGVDVEAAGFPWWDDRSCWGCDKSCKRSKFHPYSGGNIGADVRGASAARARVAADDPYSAGLVATSTRTAPPDTRRSTSVDALWDDSCEACGRHVRRVDAGLEPVRDSGVALEPCAEEMAPF